MSSSISDNTKKRGRPKTTGTGTLIGVRLLPHLLDKLDAYIEALPDPKPSRPEAIRSIVESRLDARDALADFKSGSFAGGTSEILAELERLGFITPLKAKKAG